MGNTLALTALPPYADCSFLDDGQGPRLKRCLRWVLEGLGLANAAVLDLLHTASILYLVTESSLSLRHVPIGAYAAVPWVQNIPHV